MSSNVKTQTTTKSSAIDEKELGLIFEIVGDFAQYLRTPQEKAMFRRKLEEYKDQYRAFHKENIEG